MAIMGPGATWRVAGSDGSGGHIFGGHGQVRLSHPFNDFADFVFDIHKVDESPILFTTGWDFEVVSGFVDFEDDSDLNRTRDIPTDTYHTSSHNGNNAQFNHVLSAGDTDVRTIQTGIGKAEVTIIKDGAKVLDKYIVKLSDLPKPFNLVLFNRTDANNSVAPYTTGDEIIVKPIGVSSWFTVAHS